MKCINEGKYIVDTDDYAIKGSGSPVCEKCGIEYHFSRLSSGWFHPFSEVAQGDNESDNPNCCQGYQDIGLCFIRSDCKLRPKPLQESND